MVTKRFILICVLALSSLTIWAQQDTTAFMRRLVALPGVSGVTRIQSDVYPEKYVMKIQQNVDGDTPEKGTFGQRVIVGFKGLDRPTVIVTEGYYADYALDPRYEEELCALFNANLVFCEYRYFSESVPEPCNWDYMTVDNSLRDLHHVRQTMGEVFKKKWISTGISKGGQTTMFYRATYPDDVDVSVSYVAPLNRSVEDGRHEKFISKKVGTQEEREAVANAQREFLKRKPHLLPMFEDLSQHAGYQYNLPTSDIYDYCVMEFSFALWQWGTPVSTIPDVTETDSVWFNYFVSVSEPDYFTCPSQFMPFHVQALRELGYYGYSRKGLKKYMDVKRTKGYMKQIMLPEALRGIHFDKTLYRRTVKFLKEQDPTHIFIYGEVDPWTASGVAGWLDCSKKKNMRVYVQPRGSHRARIGNMPDDMKAEIMSRLTEWLK